MDALEVKDIYLQYGEFVALAGVSLTVPEGGCVAVVGPNGAGKSSLFGVIGGQVKADRGQVIVHGRDLTALSAFRRSRLGLARTFQVTRLPRSFTVMESVVLACSAQLRGVRVLGDPMRNRKLLATGAQALELVRLTAIANNQVSSLTQGERKRLEFGMAIAQDASVLLLDEPTAGMSAEEVAIAVDVLRDIQRERPKAGILFSSHDMDVVFGLGERVLVMNQGMVIADGTPTQVAADQRVIEIYLGVQ